MNTFKRPLLAVIGFFSLSVLGAAAGCSNEEFDPNSPGQGPGADSGAPDALGSADGGASDGTTPDGGTPDSAVQPDATPCTPSPGEDRPDDDFADTNCDGIDGDVTRGVFVAPTGDDSAAGGISAPVASLSKAVELAQAAQKDVYVCKGTYGENVVLETTGVALYGGYDCTKSWSRSSERAVVAPGSGIPLRIKNADNTVIDRLELRAPEGVDPGESSIAVTVQTSQGVVFNRAELVAKDGAPGAPGANVNAVTTAAPSGATGAIGSGKFCVTASPLADCKQILSGGVKTEIVKCGGSLGHRGGDGGKGGNVYLGAKTEKGHSGIFLGAPGGQPGFAGIPGQPGAAGNPGEPGGKFGSVVDGIYLATNAGTDANSGKMGKAGGGGSGGTSWWVPDVSAWFVIGAGGGQGGYPGCGGDGGKAGGGGGASIALIVTSSDVSISWSKLKTAAGGDGGSPSDGSAGQPGGKGGAGGACKAGGGCEGKPGGDGGGGGKGGPGGPGGGGPSIGVLTAGTAPTATSTTYDVGAPGKGASGFNGKDGADGETGETISLTATP